MKHQSSIKSTQIKNVITKTEEVGRQESSGLLREFYTYSSLKKHSKFFFETVFGIQIKYDVGFTNMTTNKIERFHSMKIFEVFVYVNEENPMSNFLVFVISSILV